MGSSYDHNVNKIGRVGTLYIVQRIVSDVEFVAENIVTYVQTYNYLESKQMKHKNFMEGKFAAGYFEEEEESENPRPNSIYIRFVNPMPRAYG